MPTNFGPQITDKQVAALPVREKAYHHTLGAVPGFTCCVNPSGSRSFHVWYRTKSSRPRRVHLGSFPATTVMEAFRRARDIRSAVEAGRDPAQELQDKVAAERRDRSETIEAILPMFYEQHCQRLKSHDEIRWRFGKYVLPYLPKKPVRHYSRRDIAELVDCVARLHGPATARSAYAWVKVFFEFCDRKALIDENASPCRHIHVPEAVRRERVLDDDELRLIWRASRRLPLMYGGFVRLLMLTGQRRREVAGMHRAELNGSLWTIPAGRMKGQRGKVRDHEVPLSTRAVKLIEELPKVGQHVFCTGFDGNDQPITSFGYVKDRIDQEMAAPDAALAGSIEPWTFHDIRRTMRTRMSDLGIPPHVAERVIAHAVGGKVEQTYDRHMFRAEKAAALQAWDDALAAITGDDPEKKSAPKLTLVSSAA